MTCDSEESSENNRLETASKESGFGLTQLPPGPLKDSGTASQTPEDRPRWRGLTTLGKLLLAIAGGALIPSIAVVKLQSELNQLNLQNELLKRQIQQLDDGTRQGAARFEFQWLTTGIVELPLPAGPARTVSELFNARTIVPDLEVSPLLESSKETDSAERYAVSPKCKCLPSGKVSVYNGGWAFLLVRQIGERPADDVLIELEVAPPGVQYHDLLDFRSIPKEGSPTVILPYQRKPLRTTQTTLRIGQMKSGVAVIIPLWRSFNWQKEGGGEDGDYGTVAITKSYLPKLVVFTKAGDGNQQTTAVRPPDSLFTTLTSGVSGRGG